MSINAAALKSGTDIRGKALGEGAQLTEEVAKQIGRAFVVWVSQRVGKAANALRLAIGRDSRLSGASLLAACAAGMAEQGAQVKDFGLCTTPAMYKALTPEHDVADASIMVTASHHPSDRNGFKFFLPSGGIQGKDLDALLTLMEQSIAPSNEPGAVEPVDFLKVYCEDLAETVRQKLDDPVPKPLLGLHIVVDAGNGAGGFYASLLENLGASTKGSQFLDPDGHFPNHPPNPENGEAMQSLSDAVLRAGADLGVIFDADCDRAALVDAKGLAINRNRLIAVVSAMLLDDQPGLTIVTDSVTSSGLTRFIGEWGGEHYRYKRGYRNVIDEAKRLNQAGVDSPLAIETSGHAAFRENDFLDDGMYLSTVLICEAMRLKREGKEIASLLEGLQEPVEALEVRLPILAEDFREAGVRLIEDIIDYANDTPGWHIAPDNREGVRISFLDTRGEELGWFLLRISVHDPVMPLNLESERAGGTRMMLEQLLPLIEAHDDIDAAPIKEQLA